MTKQDKQYWTQWYLDIIPWFLRSTNHWLINIYNTKIPESEIMIMSPQIFNNEPEFAQSLEQDTFNSQNALKEIVIPVCIKYVANWIDERIYK